MKRKAGKQVVGAKPLPPPKGSGGQAAAGKGKAHRNKVRGREKIPKGGRSGVFLLETSRLSLLIECASSLGSLSAVRTAARSTGSCRDCCR